jgi:hypothetical protein
MAKTRPTTQRAAAKPPKLRCVFVEWEDAGSLDGEGWVHRSTAPAPEPHMFKQVGFIVSVDESALVLTEAYNEDQMAPRTRIPVGMIRRIVDLDEFIK